MLGTFCEMCYKNLETIFHGDPQERFTVGGNYRVEWMTCLLLAVGPHLNR